VSCFDFDEEGKRVGWELQRTTREVTTIQECNKCCAEIGIGEWAEYVVTVYAGEFSYGYACFICTNN
jgi:hypothetical protein